MPEERAGLDSFGAAVLERPKEEARASTVPGDASLQPLALSSRRYSIPGAKPKRREEGKNAKTQRSRDAKEDSDREMEEWIWIGIGLDWISLRLCTLAPLRSILSSSPSHENRSEVAVILQCSPRSSLGSLPALLARGGWALRAQCQDVLRSRLRHRRTRIAAK